MFGKSKTPKDKSQKVKVDKRTKIVITRYEMQPSLSDLQENVNQWLEHNKFQPAPEYGKNYYIRSSYGAGTFSIQYEITPEEDLILYCHYLRPEFAKPLNISDPSMKAMHHMGVALEQIFKVLKGPERFRPEEVSQYFQPDK